MHTRRFSIGLVAAILLAFVLQHFLPTQSPAQAAGSRLATTPANAWVQLNDYSGKPSRPVWVNLGRADTITFYTGSYDTRRNVPQATVMLGRNEVIVIEPQELALLHRYIQAH